MKRFVLQGWSALFLAGSLWVAPVVVAEPVMDLSMVYRLALEQDPILQAAENRLRAGSELVPQARAALQPSIDLQAETSRTQEGDSGLGDGRTEWTAGVSLVQPVLRLGVLALRDRAGIELEQFALRVGQARQGVLLRVSDAYFDVLLAQDDIGSLEAEQRAISTELRRAERALEVGSGTVTAVNEARARFDLVEARRLRADNTLQIARENLRRLIGRDPGTLAGLRSDFEAEPPLPMNPRAWGERAERESLQVRAARNSLLAAQEDLRIEEYERLPSVDLVAGLNRISRDVGGAGSTQRNVGQVTLRLSMPLFTGGGLDSRVRQRQAERDASSDDVRDARRIAGLEAESAYLNLVSIDRQIGALEQALRSIISTEESTRRGLEVGLRTTLDLLNAQRDRFETERELAASRYAYLLEYLRLQVAVGGGLDQASVDDVNFFLDSDNPS